MAGKVIARLVRELCTRADFPPATPHDFRRTTATVLAEHWPIQVVRDILGHTHVTATERYVRQSADVARAAAASMTLPDLARG